MIDSNAKLRSIQMPFCTLEAERDALRKEVARQNQEIRRRQMELDILKKAEEIIKKAPGISISHLNMLANDR